MATLASMSVNLYAQTAQFEQGMRRASGITKGFQATVDHVTSTVGRFGGALGAAIGIGTGLASLGKGFALAAQFEQAEIAMTTMLNSGEAAKSLLNDLAAFAASTPFEFPELVGSAKSLVAFGVGAQAIIPTLRSIGDIASGVGAPVGELAELFGKAKVQGTLFAEDINQLVNRGIPVIQEFAKQLGVSESAVKKMASQGKITFANLEQAFADLTGEGGKFAGLMDAQSRSLGGIWSNVVDNVTQSLQSMAQVVVEAFDLRAVLSGIASLAGRLRSLFDAMRNHPMGDVSVTFIKWGASLVTASIVIPRIVTALKAMYLAIRSVAQAQTIALALSGPKGWAMLAGGLLIAAGAASAVAAAFSDVEGGADGATRAIREGEAQLDRYNQRLRDMGLLVTEQTTKQLEKLRKQLDSLRPADAEAEVRMNIPGGTAEFAEAMELLDKIRFQTEANFSTDFLDDLGRSIASITKTSEELSLERITAEFGEMSLVAMQARGMLDRLRGLKLDKDVSDLTASLQEQAATFGMSAAEISIYRLQLRGATDAQLASARAAAEMIDAQIEAARQEELRKGIDQTIQGLRDQIAVFDMTAGAAEMYRMLMQGASLEQAQLAGQLATTADQMQRASQIFDQTRTPMERYTERMAELNELLNAGRIDWDTYSRAVDQANKALKEQTQIKDRAIDTSPVAAREVRFGSGGPGGGGSAMDKLVKIASDEAKTQQGIKNAVEQTRDAIKSSNANQTPVIVDII